MWLNIVAMRGMSVSEIVHEHWKRYGRNYYSRHDYEAIDSHKAKTVMTGLKEKLASLHGQTFRGETVKLADSFTYLDKVDGSISENQGLRTVSYTHLTLPTIYSV